MKDVIAVGLGSFIGGVGRYYISILCLQYFPLLKFPIATFIANLIGCFLIGILFGLYEYGYLSEQQKLMLMTGILGGFTTFSAFGLETMQLFYSGKISLAIIYIISSIVIGLLSVWIGMNISTKFNY
jgi:CrcB protein